MYVWEKKSELLGLTVSADIMQVFFIAALNAQDLQFSQGFSERAKQFALIFKF